LSNQLAAAIQAMTRGRITRQMYQTEMKQQCNAIIFGIEIGQDIMGASHRSGRMRHKVEEEGCKIEGEGGAGWQLGTSCSASKGVALGKGICLSQAPMERRWRSGNDGQGMRRNGR
jgi:hypothetical protein